jgi:hypothetical protein
MLVVIDESGDPGFTIGCSPFFIMGMVLFRTSDDAEEVSRAVDNARKIARIKGEFKFTQTSYRVKKIFFEILSSQNFEIRVYIVDKVDVKAKEIKINPAEFYRFCLAQLVTCTGDLPDGFTIKIDKCGNKLFRNSCASYLRQNFPAGKIGSFKMADSTKDNLVQLADMVTGAIARKYVVQDKNNHNQWYKTIKHLINQEVLGK